MNDRAARVTTRRGWLAGTVAAGAAAALAGAAPAPAALAAATGERRFTVFIKFLNELSYDELAERMAALGFGGIEATIRSKDGYILPEKAATELPKFAAALKKQGLALSIVTTDILDADQPHAEAVLRAAAEVGAPLYRLGFYRFTKERPVVEQIEGLKPRLAALAALNRRAGIGGVYQNHAGADFVGATLWDLYYLLRDHRPEELGCVYDLRHAAVEAGEAWPTLYSVIQPHVRAYSVKDFVWNGRKSQHVPLGEGVVDPEFYQRLAKSDFAGPVSLHVEYLKEGDPARQLAAVERDFAVLRKWMG